MLRAYCGLVRKEFTQIRRDRLMLRMIFIAPIIQLLFLGYAINTDVKNVSIDIYDLDRSRHSRELAGALDAGEYFRRNEDQSGRTGAELWRINERFRRGESDMAMIIPPDFSESLLRDSNTVVGLLIDGADANQARTGLGYATQIVNQYARRHFDLEMPLKIRHTSLYNPEAESVYYMVPGIVATLLTMITIMLTGMSIVRERETGTLEQVMVTPMSGATLLAGKITTSALLGFLLMTVALTVGVLWFGIPFVGSPILLFALSALYLLTTLGLGMFFSTVTSTQQQAMFLSWFFAIFALLTSGFFSPIANMPNWMQHVTLINPLRYFMSIVRGIIMKGAGVAELAPDILALLIFGVTIFSFSVIRFRKRVD